MFLFMTFSAFLHTTFLLESQHFFLHTINMQEQIYNSSQRFKSLFFMFLVGVRKDRKQQHEHNIQHVHVHIFIYERKEGGEKKADGAMVALRHSCLSGFAYQNDIFRYFKKASYILLTNSWGYTKNLLNSFNNILQVSLKFFKFTVL